MTPETLKTMHSSASNEWATPQAFFDKLNAEFHFELDAAATKENAKCRHFLTKEDDSLSRAWGLYRDWRLGGGLVIWLNPPYGRELGKWMERAHRTARAGATVVCLVPARTDTKWFWDSCAPHEIRFVRGRLKFGDGKGSAPFPSMVVVMRPGLPIPLIKEA